MNKNKKEKWKMWKGKIVNRQKSKKKKKCESGGSVIKIPIWILKSYDFTILHHEIDSNHSIISQVIESV